jgi:restriction endonuclease Mrr
MLDTIDELIKRTLISKNYIDDNIISAMSPATVNDIISVDEWLNVFDMPVNDEQENNQELYEETVEKLNNLSLEDYRKTLSSFFLKLGYAKIKILKHENSESFDITGEGKSGTQKVSLFSIVLLDKIITMKKIKKIIVDVSLAQKNNTFIITRGKFKKGCTEIAKNNVTLLDVEKLAAYLVNLRLVS